MSYQLRKMQLTDLYAGYVMSQKLSWPHREQDWLQGFRLGAGFVAVDDEKVIGTILYWRWSDKAATLGLVIVDDAYQGHGIGRALMNAAIEACNSAAIKLHATVMGKYLYEKLGFVSTGELVQYQTKKLSVCEMTAPVSDLTMRKATLADLMEITQLDAQSSSFPRENLWSELICANQTQCLINAENKIVGVSTLRDFGRGYAIGPTIAPNLDSAKWLISYFLAESAGKFVRIDSNLHSGLNDWLLSQGLENVDSPIEMVKGQLPESKSQNYFTLMTQALG